MSMRLTDHDASFLYTETPDTPMHGIALSVIEGEVDFQTFLRHIEGRLHRIPRYRQRLAFVPFNLAHPQWVDDEHFDPNSHVRLTELAGEATLDDAIAAVLRLAEPLLPRDKPLWAIHVVAGVPGMTVVGHVAHHAMVDGATGVDISQILFDIQPDITEPDEAQSWQPGKCPDAMVRATQAMRENSDAFAGAVQRMQGMNPQRAELIRRATESVTRFISEPVFNAPWNRGMVRKGREFRFCRFPFATIRRIRHALGGTVNDVALTIAAEAAARYLRDQGEAPHGRHLRIMCPVNVRRESDKGVLSNRVSGIFPVFDAHCMNAVERHKYVRWETEQIKQNREAQALQLLTEMIPPMPPDPTTDGTALGSIFGAPSINFATFNPLALLSRFAPPLMPNNLAQLPLAGFNFTFTNVPGVQTTQYLLGHKVVDQLAVLMLAGNLGYGMAIMSYDQALTFNLVADPSLMPDLGHMAELVEAVFYELAEAAGVSTE